MNWRKCSAVVALAAIFIALPKFIRAQQVDARMSGLTAGLDDNVRYVPQVKEGNGGQSILKSQASRGLNLSHTQSFVGLPPWHEVEQRLSHFQKTTSASINPRY